MLLPWLGAGLVALGVVAYWLYTLAGLQSLAPYLRGRRQALMVGGLALAGLGLLTHGVTEWRALLPIGVAVPLFAYAHRRQWLFPVPAPRLVRGEHTLPPDTPVAVIDLGDERAVVPLELAARHRTSFVGDTLLVHCRLSFSVSAFEGPGDAIAAVLPAATGFRIGTPERTWDGIDGRALDGGSDLTPKDVLVTTADRAEGAVYGTAPPPYHIPTPRTPAARAVTDPMARGAEQDGAWIPVELAEESTPRTRYLSRWTALERGLRI